MGALFLQRKPTILNSIVMSLLVWIQDPAVQSCYIHTRGLTTELLVIIIILASPYRRSAEIINTSYI